MSIFVPDHLIWFITGAICMFLFLCICALLTNNEG